MTTHSNILAWEIPQAEEPGRLQSMGLQRVGQDLVTEHKQSMRILVLKEDTLILFNLKFFAEIKGSNRNKKKYSQSVNLFLFTRHDLLLQITP